MPGAKTPSEPAEGGNGAIGLRTRLWTENTRRGVGENAKSIVVGVRQQLSNASLLLGFSFCYLATTKSADAQEAISATIGSGLLNSTEIIMLSVFGGAMSFALLSAFWLIRERARILGVNSDLRHRLFDLRAGNERLEALVNVADQRIVVWNGTEDRPLILGDLASTHGVPDNREEFLAFGRWLKAESAIGFEKALRRLRSDAEAFDLPLVTVNNGVLEAQGRTSGSHAFVRFIELSAERKTMVKLEAEHARLNATFDTIQSLFETLPNPVWLRDATGELFWVNAAYAKAVDCDDNAQAVEQRLELLDSAERREVGRAQAKSQAFHGELPAVVAGDRRVLDVAEVRSDTGSAGMATDRSELEAVRATLKQTISTHAQTLDYLATAIAMFDAKQHLLFYNSSFQKLWDLPEGFLESKPSNAQVLDAIRAEKKLPEFPDWRKWRESQLEIYQALEAHEDWWHLPDGETLRVIVNPHSQGGATWVFENVTEQLALQSNYNALMRTQGETLDNLTEAVAVFGLDGKLRLCNPAFTKIWGLDKKQVHTGLHISALSKICGEQVSEGKDWVEIASAITDIEQEAGDISGRFETIDGAAIDYAIVRLPEGQIMLALVDMTDSVNVERALKDRNEALEQSDRLKSRFIEHVSYEFRAPLTSIAGFSELLATPYTGKLNAKQSEYVEHISSSADTLRILIDDILDLATADAGAMVLEMESIDLHEAVQQCVEDFDDRISAKGIRVKTAIASAAESLKADRQRMQQILSHLLANAISFSPDGGEIDIAARHFAEMLELSVCDQGPGVAEEDRGAIFDRFEVRTGGNRRKGAGLGLSIVKSFVELHGGSVHVEAAGERGARFVCRFPLSADEVRKAA